MRRFIISFLKFCFFSLILSVVSIVVFSFYHDVSYKDFPPPKISDSYSFNDKLDFARGKKSNVLIIGSSMSLNNVSSNVIIDRLHERSCLNLSSWGLCMTDIYRLLKVTSKFQTFKTLIIASNIGDFDEDSKDIEIKYDENELLAFMNSKWNGLYHLNHFDLKYYIRNWPYKKAVKSGTFFNESLLYDSYGTVGLAVENFRVDSKRWEKDFVPVIKNDLNYRYLDSISTFCSKHKIQLLFFQSPTRKQVLTHEKSKILSKHIHRVEKIVAKRGHFFVNSSILPWDDIFFVDGTHLNSKGAEIFTKFCFDKLSRHEN